KIQEAVTPGREHEGDKTWLMARRVVAKWGDKPEISAPDAPTRRFVSTRLRHLRLSPDGSTLVVKSEKGGVDHELALDELLEVHETPSEESVTLMGKDIEIRIAFKGQAKALKQFRNMLVPAGANAAASGNSVTMCIVARPQPVATQSGASPSGSATGSTPSASATSTPEVSARASENSTGGNDAVERSGGGPDAGLSTDSQGVSKRSSGGLMPHVRDSSSLSHGESTRSIMSPGSSVSGWGSVKGDGGMARVSGGSNGSKLSTAAGSTFADARERERVIAELQN
ncbi:unnamed protein product, partial [Sphacelaria rigidula]